MSLIVKICGITCSEDARAACEAGADWLGFVFYRKSPRYVEPTRARAIIAHLPPHVRPVAVVVNQSVEQLRLLARETGIQTLQCHGNESPETLRQLDDLTIVKACAPRCEDDLDALLPYADWPLLLDTPTVLHGGSGRVSDWQLAATAARRFRVMLAGGLTPDNVTDAIATVQPFGVDVSSGVERTKGRKDHAKVVAFIRAARHAP